MTDIKILVNAQQAFIDQLKKDRASSSTILAYRADLNQLIDFLQKKKVTHSTSVTTEILENYKDYLIEKKL